MLYIICDLQDDAVIEDTKKSIQRVDKWQKSIINVDSIDTASFDAFIKKIAEIHNGIFPYDLPFMMIMGCPFSIKPYPNSEWISGRLRLNPCFLTIFEFHFLSGSPDESNQSNDPLVVHNTDEALKWFTLNWSVKLNPIKPSMVRIGSKDREADFLVNQFKQYSTGFEATFSQSLKSYISNWSELINGQLPVRVLSPGQDVWLSGFMKMACRMEIHLYYDFLESSRDLKRVFTAKSEVSPLDEIRQMLDESSK